MEHKWEICAICGPMVRCGYCGNNCCNGGTGEIEEGVKCGCKEAYTQQGNGPPEGFVDPYGPPTREARRAGFWNDMIGMGKAR